MTPSVVGFAKSGEILVGKKAKRGAVMNVGRTVFSIKRHMGTQHRVNIEGKSYTPQEISAMILQKLKCDTEDYFGEEINQAVVTVPAYFTDAQRQATKDAGEIAGLKVRRIIDEPTAAALAYGLDKEAGPGADGLRLRRRHLRRFDHRGGLRCLPGAGDPGQHAPGRRRHRPTHRRLAARGVQEEQGVDLSDDPIAMQRLKEAAEEAKIELSEVKETHILVEAISMTEKGPLTLDTILSREQVRGAGRGPGLQDDRADDAGDRRRQPDAGEDRHDPARGRHDTHTGRPAVVKETLGKHPHRDLSPEEVVALGAAVQTLVLAPIGGEIEDTLAARYGKEKPVIIHMTPFSLGVGLQNDQFGVIIERNSTYPTEAKDIFTTTRDFQEAISFPIYEGEEPIASENTFLDLLRIEGITPAPRGVPRIEVTFKLTRTASLEAQRRRPRDRCREEDHDRRD